MIIKFWLSVMFLFLVAPALFAAEERYLCVADKATGFNYNSITKEWVQTNFKGDDKYLITKSNSKLISNVQKLRHLALLWLT
jgi:hypothetical protein